MPSIPVNCADRNTSRINLKEKIDGRLYRAYKAIM